MEMIKSIAEGAGAITGTAAVVTLIVKICKYFKNISEKIDSIERHCCENYMGNLRLTVISPDMPMSERLIAGEKYITAGGNGEVKAKYNALKAVAEAREKEAIQNDN